MRGYRTKRAILAASLLVLAAGLALGFGSRAPAATGGCGLSPVACENQQPGNPATEWDLTGPGDPSIVGYATSMSVNHGETAHFKVKTTANAYRIDIYRLGWYGGDGARKVATVTPSAALPQTQPACVTQSATGLVDCGNWAESASWAVPSDAVSGIYIAKLVRTDNGKANHIVFIVRDDESRSNVLFQTSDTTWQAYNRYGGNSLYVGSPAGRAYKVSYNRPFTTRDYASSSWLFEDEYPMLRWLERNGYDVSYFTGVDTAQRGSLIRDHKAFLSVGHDEYWSAEQRASVEAARDAGVSLGFFSGNAIFWKTRWEPSIDGSATDYRTLVSYKETKASAKIDPSPTWTGTWRDKRFSPPADGGRPENALQGTFFTVNSYRQDPMNVSATEGKLRFWRSTSVATLSPGETATFPAGILGHEWDEDIDNGFRPTGLFDLSSTTLSVDKHLIDEGNTFVAGSATHHLTLYRASSGALVFGAGTCQWSWTLDAEHDVFSGTAPPVDSRIQQATVNLFADMGVQPTTLQSDLVAATASTDTTAPSSTITAPPAGTVVDSGSVITIRGTAADTGGVVAGVEVSVDGGQTWHPATGRESWTYSWTVGGIGDVTLKSRAIDDSGNIESSGGGTVTVVVCPCSLWSDSTIPSTPSSPDRNAVELGVKFRPDNDGYITGIRFYKGLNNTGTHVGSLWTTSGALLARATFTAETTFGWQEVSFDSPAPVTAGTTYVASYYAPQGGYAVDAFFFSSSGFANPPLRALADGTVGGNGIYDYSPVPTFPRTTHKSSNYSVDVAFNTIRPPDTKPPIVTATSPTAGATSADSGGAVTATFSEAVDPATVSTGTFELRTAGGALVPSSASYDAATRTATLTPASALANSSNYTATVKGGSTGVKDLSGNPLAADFSWTFTTLSMRTCPCTLWPNGTTPTTASVGDSQSVELGVKFRADADGYVTAIRFYKGSRNTGTHVGSLWTSSGTLLARATFNGETGTGWQEVALDEPVAVSAGTTYVASYHAPAGGYAVNPSYFATSTYANPPLRALKDGIDGANGTYLYSSSPSFPTATHLASNYWVDVVYSTTPPIDTTPPRVTSVTPASGSTSAAPSTDVTAVFSESLDPATVTTTSFVLRNGSTTIPATVGYDVATRTATLHPSAPLTYGAAYTATLQGGSGGIKDAAGNPLASDYSWSFSTRNCPCTLWSATATPEVESSSDSGAVDLGVKFHSDISGWVTGVRFYKGSRNTGTHVGSLWSSTGTLLARATFTNETASGWQQVSFDGPVAISANTTYVVSYHAPNGGYSVNGSFFASTGFASPPLTALSNGASGGNGVYAYGAAPSFPTQSYGATNYWVDVVFATAPPADTTAPRVDTASPANGAQASTGTVVKATFSEPVDPATIDGNRLQLKDGTGAAVPADVAYDAGSRTATVTPHAPLSYGQTYTATVKGGSTGIKDLAGNALASDFTWSFSTRACPCTIFSPTAVPEIQSSGDTNPVELGVKFRSEVTGYVTGIRFYKGVNNTGTHVGSLWTSSGTLLAQTTFSGETATGWQQASFATPVPITANTTYVASYFAPNGGWAVNAGFFASPFVSPPLTALASGTDGPNGLYLYGSAPVFPTQSFNASNYSVDVVFSLTP